MRKIITTTFITIDGVMQAPGGPEEDTTSDFAWGGWQASVPHDEALMSKLMGFISGPYELLLGRKTYDIFAGYWPVALNAPKEVADPFNKAKKYVVSHTPFEPAWNNTACISGDVVAEIKKLKEADGPDLWVHGSGNLIQTLLKNNLVDRMHLWIYPLTIGSGKKLFEEGTQPRMFALVESITAKSGVIFATYEPAGTIVPGRMDE